ncbi:MAG: MoxR family ATPase [Myxococcota bacterium]|jgi:MoxR-like ATPase|nr:MoxR family ATPase [Myxococcota bacterium]
MDPSTIRELYHRAHEQISRVIVGQDHAISLLMTALLSEGHILLEGVPGTAKTLLAQTFASVLSLDFKRIQFTPDLMPGDLLGTNLFNFQTNQFVFSRGPIFTELLLADEINRTPPKTQSALLQAMQERKITIDVQTYALGTGFMVIATQNPIEQEGTYPLPEAQLDRFLFKVIVDYPSRDQERAVVQRHGRRSGMPRLSDFALEPVADLATIDAMREAVSQVELSEPLVDYIVDIVRATRQHPSLLAGASPRTCTMLATAVRALAALEGRSYVIPDDIKQLVPPTLAHRLVLAPGAEIEGHSARAILAQLLNQLPAPR